MKRACLAAIVYTTRAFYGNSPEISPRNKQSTGSDIMSNLENGQSVLNRRYD